MKKLVSLILVFTFVISCVSMVSISANSELQDITPYLTYEIIDNEAIITSCDNSISGNFYLPETLGGYPVTKIKKLNQFGDNLFSYCKNIESITIPDSVTYIDSYAFSQCYNLASIKLSSNLKFIGEYAFEKNYALKNIVIPNGVETIGNYAFSQSGLESISLPDSLHSLYIGTFDQCRSLESIHIPKGVTTIERMVFMKCDLLSEITVDSANTVFYAEGNCIIEKATKKIVAGCNNSVLPDNIEIIGDSAFYGCENLKQVTIPNCTTIIEIDAFSNCESLEKIILPKNLKTIGNHTFWCCTALKEIVVDDCLESIDDYAFYGCDKMETVYYTGTAEQWNDIVIGNGNECLTTANIVYNYSNSAPTPAPEGAITGATVDVGSTLTINYFAEAPEDAIMKFTSSSGRITEVNGVLDEKTGYYKFAYTGINPQCMGDTIKAELIWGDYVLDTKESYSVKAYCENQISKSASDLGLTETQYNALKTLLADMLVYGSEAQKYKDYNVSELPDVDEWVSTNKSTFTSPTGVKKVTGNADAENKVKSVGLNMANVNRIYFKLILNDENVVIKLNDKVIDRAELIKNADGTFILYSSDIKATGFNDVYTLTLTQGEEVISTVEYNVNAYIQAKNSDATVGDIVKALSNYGTSAKRYHNFIADDDFDLEDDIL